MNFRITLLLVLISYNGYSCDVCGGIMPAGNQDLIPGNQFHFVGLRASISSFNSYHDDRESFEQFSRSSIVGRFQLNERVDLQMDLPFHYKVQTENNERSSMQGIGDMVVQCNYLWINRADEKERSSISFRSGIGVKLPTGKFSKNAWETNNLYPGSGSFDYSVQSNFIYMKRKLGVRHEFTGSYKTSNSAGYRYGHSVNTRLEGLYIVQFDNSRLIPACGIGYFYSGKDRIDNIPVTGSFNYGHSINGELGLNYLINNWMLSVKYSLPIYQKIDNGNVMNKGIGELSIIYLIQKK